MNAMNNQTKQKVGTIRNKVKNSLKGTYEFPNDDAVIQYAVEMLFNDLKKKHLI